MTTTTVKQMKCACPSCLCIVDLKDAIVKADQYYCSESCAEGHVKGDGCGHGGCGCHS